MENHIHIMVGIHVVASVVRCENHAARQLVASIGYRD